MLRFWGIYLGKPDVLKSERRFAKLVKRTSWQEFEVEELMARNFSRSWGQSLDGLRAGRGYLFSGLVIDRA
ncbi:MAG TPA: hypothetical protein EYP19_15650 [Desulfobacterales bacterium]|nr:hypothetical protein [Desulfobacterales bacterium]